MSASTTANESVTIRKLIIRPWPKMILLWPTGVLACIMALSNHFMPAWANIWGGFFLVIMAINFFVLTFDFPRGTSLTLTMAGIAVVLLLLLLNHNFAVIKPLREFFTSRAISASTEFYWVFFLVFLALYIGMFIITRFDFWELTANEVIHHHGVLGDVERFSTAGLKMNKEITDLFEYVLAGSGRMILLIPSAPRPVVLDNVLNIGRIERLATEILEARVVRVEGPAKASVMDAVTMKDADEG